LIAAIEALTGAVCFTIRRTLIAVPGSIATSARRLMLHLSINWHGNKPGPPGYNRVCSPPVASEVRKPPHASTVETSQAQQIKISPESKRWIEA
jgi:hypothetical protein